MKRTTVAVVLSVLLASGTAFAQGGQPSVQNAPPGTTGDKTQRTIPGSESSGSGASTGTSGSATTRPTATECNSGWTSSMRWTQADFQRLCTGGK